MTAIYHNPIERRAVMTQETSQIGVSCKRSYSGFSEEQTSRETMNMKASLSFLLNLYVGWGQIAPLVQPRFQNSGGSLA